MLNKLGMFYKEFADLLEKYGYYIEVDADDLIEISIWENPVEGGQKYNWVAGDIVYPCFDITEKYIREGLANAEH